MEPLIPVFGILGIMAFAINAFMLAYFFVVVRPEMRAWKKVMSLLITTKGMITGNQLLTFTNNEKGSLCYLLESFRYQASRVDAPGLMVFSTKSVDE